MGLITVAEVAGLKSTDVLSSEHRAIEIVLNALEKSAQRLDSGEHVDPSLVADCLEFATGFADRCHHTKEEQVLFPALEAKGVTREGGPVGVMLHEHDEGRSLLRSIRTHLDAWTGGIEAPKDGLTQAIGCYVNLLRSHIAKEDQVLFVVASGIVSDEEDDQLLSEFDRVEEETIGRGVHERYHALLDDIRQRAGRL